MSNAGILRFVLLAAADFGVSGAIGGLGGASLGAALGYLENKGLRSRRHRVR